MAEQIICTRQGLRASEYQEGFNASFWGMLKADG
jgi:hypothetical protein